jgi:hypothetical protein
MRKAGGPGVADQPAPVKCEGPPQTAVASTGRPVGGSLELTPGQPLARLAGPARCPRVIIGRLYFQVQTVALGLTC